MRKALRVKTTVQSGGNVEVVSPEQRLFRTAEQVRAYLAEEKASWDR